MRAQLCIAGLFPVLLLLLLLAVLLLPSFSHGKYVNIEKLYSLIDVLACVVFFFCFPIWSHGLSYCGCLFSVGMLCVCVFYYVLFCMRSILPLDFCCTSWRWSAIEVTSLPFRSVQEFRIRASFAARNQHPWSWCWSYDRVLCLVSDFSIPLSRGSNLTPSSPESR